MSYADQHQESLEKHAAFPENHPHFANVDEGKVSSTELNNYVTLFTTRHSDPLTVSFEVYCSGLTAVELTIDFDGTVNFQPTAADSFVETSSETKFVAMIRPFQRTYVGVLKLIDKSKRASLKLKFEWKLEKASDEEISRYFAWSLEKTKKEIQAATDAKFPKVDSDIDNVEVNKICQANGIRFVDLEFPPKLSSLDCCEDASEDEEFKMIEWKRPSEFMKGDIDVFEGSIEAADIIQGRLGDCWFLSALAAMTEFPQLIRDLFVDSSEHYNNNGVYTIEFYKHGLKQTIRIDDFIPCSAGPFAGPRYSRCNGNELWVMLIEKAFAKVHGSYMAIESGWTAEALVDLTGCPSRTYRFEDKNVVAKISSGELWTELCHCDKEKFLLTTTTPGTDTLTTSNDDNKEVVNTPTGLVPGHAYTLVSCVEVNGIKLCRLRNPWGSGEWTGAWSDHSPLWTDEMKTGVEVEVRKHMSKAELEDPDHNNSDNEVQQKDDGIFWMSFEDLVAHFNSVSICYVRHEKYTKTPWYVDRKKFCFDFDEVKAQDSGNNANKEALFQVRNPAYKLIVESEGEFIATVHQKDTRCEDSDSYIDVAVAIVKANPEKAGKYILMGGSGISADRQNQTNVLTLPAGEYLVVPITSGSKLRQEFEERQEAEKSNNTGCTECSHVTRKPLCEVDANGVLRFTKDVLIAFRQVFQHLDVDCNGLLSKAEYDQYLQRTENCVCSEKAFDFLLEKFEKSEENKKNRELSQRAFVQAQLYFFNENNRNETRLFNELQAIGFNHQLDFVNGRNCALSVHGTSAFTCTGIAFDENLLTETQEMIIAAHGNVVYFDNERIKVIVYRCGYFGASFMVENVHSDALVFTMDMRSSENVVSHRGSLTYTDVVPAGEQVVFHHLTPKDVNDSWSWSYSASFMWDPRSK